MESSDWAISARKFDGTIGRSWQCRLIERNDTLLTFVGIFENDVQHADLGFIRRGTISYENYWLDRWYSVFRFHEPNGKFRNYYCNINMPPVLGDRTLDYVDLDIDILVFDDLAYRVLDEDEFRENSKRFCYPEEVISNAKSARDTIISMIERREFPFDSTEDQV